MTLMRESGLAIAEEPALLERDEALEALADSLADVAQSLRGRVVFVAGEAGVGKTALLRAFCATAPREADIHWATCDALVTPRPLGPLLDLADELGGELRAAGRGRRAAARRGGVAPAAVRGARPVGRRHRGRALGRRGDARRAAARGGTRARRSAAAARQLPQRSGRPHRAAASAAGGAAIDRLGGRVWRCRRSQPTQSRCSPIRWASIRSSCSRAPAATRSSSPRRWPPPTPCSRPRFAMRCWRARRVSASPRARCSTPWPSSPAAPRCGCSTRSQTLPAGAVDECLHAGMLTADGAAVAFRHELARLAVEESLPPDRRVELHRRVLVALDGQREPRVWRITPRAPATPMPCCASRSPRPAQASAFSAHREAAEQYARALRFAGGLAPPERADMLERYAAECYLTDMRAEGIDALAEVVEIHRATGDRRRVAEALLLRARPLSCAGRGVEANAAVERGGRRFSSRSDPSAMSRGPTASRATVAMFDDRLAEAVALGERAIEIAERIGDRETLIRALNNAGTAELLRGDDRGLAMLERSLVLAREDERADGCRPRLHQHRVRARLPARLATRRALPRRRPGLLQRPRAGGMGELPARDAGRGRPRRRPSRRCRADRDRSSGARPRPHERPPRAAARPRARARSSR